MRSRLHLCIDEAGTAEENTVEILGEWDGSARRFAAKAPGPGQGQVILVQSADLRVVGAAEQPPG